MNIKTLLVVALISVSQLAFAMQNGGSDKKIGGFAAGSYDRGHNKVNVFSGSAGVTYNAFGGQFKAGKSGYYATKNGQSGSGSEYFINFGKNFKAMAKEMILEELGLGTE